MSEPTTAKKKLPFKPTALRRGLAKPTPTARSITEDEAPPVTLALSDDDDDDDSLALFRRAKEMAPIVKADHERRMRRQRQKQREQEEEEERRGAFAINERSLVESEDVVMSASTPSSHEASIMATQEEDSRRDLVTPPPSKRSRLSTSASSSRNRDVDVDHINDSVPDSPTLRSMRSLAPDRSITPAAFNTLQYTGTSVSGYSTRSQARAGGAPLSGSSQVIILDSDSETEDAARSVPAATVVMEASPRKRVVDEAALRTTSDLSAHVILDDTADDDEFSEYVRKARERRDRLQNTAHNQGPFSTATPTPGPFDPAPPPSTSSGMQTNVPAASTSPGPATSQHEKQQQQQKQYIEILVSSEIPNTKPLLFKFRFDSPMRIVRDNWTASQQRHNVRLRGPGLLERDDDEVVLTWRKQKVYMYSTLLSLGIRPSEDGDGSAVVVEEEEEVQGGAGGSGRDVYTRDGFNEAGTRVQMQAWTPAMFERMTREEEMRRKRDAGELSDDDDDGGGGGGGYGGGTQGTTTSTVTGSEAGGGGDGDESQQQQEAVKLRVILKSRDMEPVKLKVMAETTTETLVAAFRAQRPVAEGATVGLWFDGMQLEEGATMMDADIDDMDTIEVHVK